MLHLTDRPNLFEFELFPGAFNDSSHINYESGLGNRDSE